MSTPTDSAIAPPSPPLRTFVLRHPGTCSGMFWRADPRGRTKSKAELPPWPRNGATLTGVVHEGVAGRPEGNDRWLEVLSYVQAGGDASKPVAVAPGAAWMIFDQGGPLLHEVKTD